MIALLASCGGDDGTSGAGAGLTARTVEAGDVTVEIDPVDITSSGATFEIVLDTHAVELDMDVAADARLTVDGTEWPTATWDGAGPGGHHREGTLRFEGVGEPEGTVELVLSGFDEPVRATWELEAG